MKKILKEIPYLKLHWSKDIDLNLRLALSNKIVYYLHV